VRPRCRCPCLLVRDHSQRIGEGKVSVGVRVQHDHAEPILGVRRQHHGKDRCPRIGETLANSSSSNPTASNCPAVKPSPIRRWLDLIPIEVTPDRCPSRPRDRPKKSAPHRLEY
jgi:hypothetical protein